MARSEYDEGYEQGVEDTVDKALAIIYESPEEFTVDDLIAFLEGEKGYQEDENGE